MGTSLNPSLFIDPTKVITRLQVNPTLDGLMSVVLSAIEGAQLHIANILDSNFDQVARDVTYFLDSEAHSGIQPGGMFRLEIPSGFVRATPTPLVYYDIDWRMGNQTLMPTTDYKLDLVRGVLYVDADQYQENYVRLQCTTGFTPATVNYTGAAPVVTAPAEAIPDWLEEAIIAYVGIVLDVSQSTNHTGTAMEQYKRAGDHAVAILSPYIRHKAMAFRPIS